MQRLRSFLSNYHRTFAELDSVGLRVRHPRGNVFIAGPVGAGKSSLLNSLLSAILGKRVDVGVYIASGAESFFTARGQKLLLPEPTLLRSFTFAMLMVVQACASWILGFVPQIVPV